MKPSILLIEDGDDQRDLLRVLLEEEGFAVTACAHPIEALAHLEPRLPELIVLDWYTPMMNGETFVKIVRHRPGGENVPIVVLTGAPRLRAAAIDALLLKPVDLDTLLAVISRQLKQASARARTHELAQGG